MQIKIIHVGKIRERYFADAICEYKKRLSRYAAVELISVPDSPEPDNPSEKEADLVRAKEGFEIAKRIKPPDYLIALDLRGKELSSEEFSGLLAKVMLSGKSAISFVIGGSVGLSEDIKKRADFVLSFSKLTFPHRLMPVILLEQAYRAFKILRAEPYHK